MQRGKTWLDGVCASGWGLVFARNGGMAASAKQQHSNQSPPPVLVRTRLRACCGFFPLQIFWCNFPPPQDTMAKYVPKTPDILNKIRLPDLDFVDVYNQPPSPDEYVDLEEDTTPDSVRA